MIFEDVGVASTKGFAFDYTNGGACVHVPPSCMGGETSLMLGQRGVGRSRAYARLGRSCHKFDTEMLIVAANSFGLRESS